MVHLILVCDAWKKGGFLNNIFEEKGPEKSEPKSKYNLETPNQKVTVATGKYTFLISGPSSGTVIPTNRQVKVACTVGFLLVVHSQGCH